MSAFEEQWSKGTFPGWMVRIKHPHYTILIFPWVGFMEHIQFVSKASLIQQLTPLNSHHLAKLIPFQIPICDFLNKKFTTYCTFGLQWYTIMWLSQTVSFVFYHLQKDASSALAHSGAHLDLSAFSSPEVHVWLSKLKIKPSHNS